MPKPMTAPEQSFLTLYLQWASGYFGILTDHLPQPIHDTSFSDTGKWRFDFQWPAFKVAVEIDGGAYTRSKDGSRGGRHHRPKGFENDCWKLNQAALEGWLVLRFTSQMLNKQAPRCINQVCHALVERGLTLSGCLMCYGTGSYAGDTCPSCDEKIDC